MTEYQENEKECGVCTPPNFQKNNFYIGKELTVRDSCAEQTYFDEKRWMLNRMVHGWGVVCGLKVSLKDRCVYVESGLALDCCGKEILVCETASVELPKVEECGTSEEAPGSLWHVCLTYHKRPIEPITLRACDEQETVEGFNRVSETYSLELKSADKMRCPEGDPLYPLTAMREKGCDNGECGDKSRALQVHDYLTEQRMTCPSCNASCCVVLGTIELKADRVGELDNSHRRLVYTNPVLRDLIDCYHGDLPRICNVGWKNYHQSSVPMPWEEFTDLLEGVKVTFDQPMDFSTINQHSFLVGVILTDSGTGYREKLYLPACSIKPGADECEAVFVIDPDWFGDEMVLGRKSRIFNSMSRVAGPSVCLDVEIVLRGSLIRAKQGNKYLDGEAFGFPTGNGVQGGEFISVFQVAPPKRATREERTEQTI